MLRHSVYPSPVGQLVLVANDNALRAVFWANEGHARVRLSGQQSTEDASNIVLQQTEQELEEYFKGERQRFSMKLDPIGTSFQQRVWQALRQIPYGQTRSYGQQAAMIGSPKSSRAVGAANGRNPISIIVPCHRVIGANRTLTGFGGGLPAKKFLLEHEGVVL